jgi:hypothetical protein
MIREQEIFMIFVILIKNSCNHLLDVWMPICILNIMFRCTFRSENGEATTCSAFLADAHLEQMFRGFKRALSASKYFGIDIYTINENYILQCQSIIMTRSLKVFHFNHNYFEVT